MAKRRGGRDATLRWVDWFNNPRLIRAIGTSREPAEATYYATIDNLDMAA